MSLDELFNKVSEDNPDSASDSLKDAIYAKVQEKNLPDWQIRLNIMGFTPITYAGFAVAAVLICLNTYLGTGWASRLLGLDDTIYKIESVGPVTPARLPVDNPLLIPPDFASYIKVIDSPDLKK
jgi:hypothetical protein